MTDAASTRSAAGNVRLDSPLGRRIVAVTVAGSAVASLTATVVNVALPVLAKGLDADSAQQQWVVNAYTLAVAALILTGGNLGDRFGRVRVYRIGCAWFAVASLLCAIAPSIGFLIGARLLQGVGGALLTPGSLAIIESTLRPADRGEGVGQWSGLSGVASAIGPLVGGVLVGLSWRWAFVINIPVAAAVLWFGRSIPESFDRSQGPDAADGGRRDGIDVVGAVLTTVALGAISFALIGGPTGGFDTLEKASLAIGIVAALVLIPWERHLRSPMLPIDLFGIRSFAAANLVTLFVYGGMGIMFFMLPLQLQVSLKWTPVAAGAALLPVTLIMLVGSSASGAFAQRVGPRLPLTVGPLVIAAGMLLLSHIGPGGSYVAAVLPGVIVFGLGLVLSVAPVTATALGSVPDDRSGSASGVNNAVSRTGQLLAVAAIPSAVGLTGDALGNADALNAHYSTALVLGAGLVALGALSSALLFRSGDAEGPDESTGDEARTEHAHSPRHHDPSTRYHCGVDSPQLARGTRPADDSADG